MKNTIILLSIFITSFVFSQSKEYENCVDAKEVAIKDFNSGLYLCKNANYVEFTSLDSGFERFFGNLIYSQYSIYIHHFDSKILEQDLCYSNTMDSLIYKKYGDNIYKHVRTKAKEIYTISEYEKSKLLDLSKIYTDVESYPKFTGNDKIITDYLNKTFREVKNPDFNAIDFTIGIDGKIENFEVNFNISNKLDKSKLLTELNKFGTFIPGYLFGIKVKSKTWFYFE